MYVFADFEYLAKQKWFYSDLFWNLKAIYSLFLLVVYYYMVKTNVILAAERKINWYIAIVLVPPISMPLFWFKYAWPAANKSFKMDGAKSSAAI